MGTSKKTVEETYKKLSQREHVLLRPGMYIGSTSKCLEEIFVCQETLDNRVVKKMTEFTPGFLKIFDEILTNATDHATRDSGTTSIKVTCNRETGEISVWNNGAGIPVKIHKDHGIYVPELIFGHLLSGSNYDDSSQRTGAGVNGLGGKLTSLFSLRFLVETIDSEVGKKFSQEYLDNMSVVKKPKVTANSGKSYTKITFLPDYKRFSMEKDLLDADTFSLLKRRVLDCIACTNVGIYFNGEKFKGRGLVDYSKFYFSSDFPGCISELYTEKVRDSEYIWEYAVVTWDQYTQVSFVNGNNTYAGGKHVEFILNQIINKTKVYLETKKKIKDVKSSVIRERLFLFLRATIANPQFNSQTKESLTTNIKDFGCKGPVVSDKFMEKLFKTGVIDEIIAISKAKESASLAKATDGKKTNKIYVPKLEDAIWAGTAKSGECTLVLTEGLSAMTFAMWGRSVIGPQKVGVFPLKGKLINIRDASVSQLMNNEELTNLKTIIGLKIGKKYTDTSELRYSRVLCLTDADLDGSHIKALLVNIFHVNWPELLKLKTPFLQTLKTPIVKATKNKKVLEFYTEQDYHKWESSVGHTNGWTIKYFKGLGTSKKEDAQDTFRRFEELRVDYFHQDKRCDESIVLAFDKDNGKKSGEVKSSDKRKNWLADYDREVYISADTNKVSFQDLIHKELIHFSIYDNLRSIPNLCDGLKPSQRKILYYLLKNNVRKSMKVAQLSGYVSAETSYHHGETSLQQAIIGMGQDFVGTNNLNLLYPDGNFGSRLLGGKDAASPRYIFTRLADCSYIFF
jgi:DNA topoisomerase-2